MSEEDIRLDQTKIVFDTISKLIINGETCSYRSLIYDLLGFDLGCYGTLISGLTITNMLVEREEKQEQIEALKKQVEYLNSNEYLNQVKWERNYNEEIVKDYVKTVNKVIEYIEIIKANDNSNRAKNNMILVDSETLLRLLKGENKQ